MAFSWSHILSETRMDSCSMFMLAAVLRCYVACRMSDWTYSWFRLCMRLKKYSRVGSLPLGILSGK